MDRYVKKKAVSYSAALIAGFSVLTLSACAGMQGQTANGSKQEWTDGHGRNCTALKWGDSASIDCDYPNK